MKVAKVAGPNQTKVCPKCGRDLPLESYSKGNGMYGRRSICKECDHIIQNTDEKRAMRRARRDERRRNEEGYIEKEREANLRKIISSENSYKKYLLRSAKQRASKQGIPFDITISDFKHIGDRQGGTYEDSPSIDKIIPELGYVRGNVWVVSNKANRIKNNATLEELKLLIKNLEDFWIH